MNDAITILKLKEIAEGEWEENICNCPLVKSLVIKRYYTTIDTKDIAVAARHISNYPENKN